MHSESTWTWALQETFPLPPVDPGGTFPGNYEDGESRTRLVRQWWEWEGWNKVTSLVGGTMNWQWGMKRVDWIWEQGGLGGNSGFRILSPSWTQSCGICLCGPASANLHNPCIIQIVGWEQQQILLCGGHWDSCHRWGDGVPWNTPEPAAVSAISPYSGGKVWFSAHPTYLMITAMLPFHLCPEQLRRAKKMFQSRRWVQEILAKFNWHVVQRVMNGSFITLLENDYYCKANPKKKCSITGVLT